MADCCCSDQNAFVIFKNYPSKWDGVDWLSIVIKSDAIDLTNFTAQFSFCGIVRSWSDITDGIIINLTEEETARIPVGLNYGTLVVTDKEGNEKPFTTAIPILCKTWVEGHYQELDTYNMTVNATLSGENQMTITVETAKVSLDWVEQKIKEHNESTDSHQDIREDVANVHDELLKDIDELADVVDTKQDKLIAGDGIDITDNVITNTRRSAEWGNIVGSIENQEDLQEQFNTKQDRLTEENAGDNITIEYKDGIVKINGKAGGGFGEIDGGSSTSVYIDPDQIIDAGNAFEP